MTSIPSLPEKKTRRSKKSVGATTDQSITPIKKPRVKKIVPVQPEYQPVTNLVLKELAMQALPLQDAVQDAGMPMEPSATPAAPVSYVEEKVFAPKSLWQQIKDLFS